MRFVFNPFTDKLDVAALGAGTEIDFITPNEGGQLGPDSGSNINLLGDVATGIYTSGNPATSTITIVALPSSVSQVGTTAYATNSEAAAQTSATVALTPSNITHFFATNPLPSSQGGTGLSSPAAHSLIVTEGSSAFTVLGVAGNGQIPIGSIGADPVLANITSTGGTVTITNGPGSINIETSGEVSLSFDGDSGTATPSSGVIIISGGTTGLTTTASGHTVALTGTLKLANGGTNADLTASNGGIFYSTASAGAILSGTATANQALLSGSSTTPAWSTATYPATTTVNQLLYSSSANVITGLATADNGVLITSAGGVPSILSDGTTGQVLTATTGSPPSWVSPATSGTVTTVSVASANGFAGTVANATTTPAITLTTSQTGLISGNGTALTGTAITQYNVLTAGASNAPNSVAPGATSGVPLISQGSSSQPIFGTAVVAGGGTGVTTMTTAYAPVCSGTTATGALQVASTGLATSGYVFTSNGGAALPSFQAVGVASFSVNIQKFIYTGSSQTYTPTSGMVYCIIECVGGGGGGGGTASASASYCTSGGGGGGGAYGRKTVSSSTIGASQTVTIGAAGSAGTAGQNTGGNGGATSVGSICTANGGSGGIGNSGGSSFNGGAGGTAGTGDIAIPGGGGEPGQIANITSYQPPSSYGGSSYFGASAGSTISPAANSTGPAGQNYGSGGAGGSSYNNGGTQAGAAGAAGFVIITEYIT